MPGETHPLLRERIHVGGIDFSIVVVDGEVVIAEVVRNNQQDVGSPLGIRIQTIDNAVAVGIDIHLRRGVVGPIVAGEDRPGERLDVRGVSGVVGIVVQIHVVDGA